MSNPRNHTSKRIVRTLSRTVDNAVLLTLLVCLLLAGYSLWDTHQVNEEADVARYATYKPTVDDTKSFEELRAMNSDVMGWLTIYGTSIDYPVVKAQKNNIEYLSRNPEGDWESCGSLYVDYQNNPNFVDFNTVIHGHHMAEHKMFGDLDLFVDQTFFNEHQYANLFYEGANHGVEIFSVLKVDAYTPIIGRPNITDEAAKENLLNMIRENQLHGRNTEVTINDHIVIMATCNLSATNGRFVLVGKILDHEVANPFPEEERVRADTTINLFSIVNRFKDLPIWIWILILIGLIVVIWILYELEKKRLLRKRDKKSKENP